MTEPGFQVFSFLRPEDVRRIGGMPPRAIVGLVDPRVFAEPGAALTPELFRPNPRFREFMHDVLARSFHRADGIKAEAKRLGEGSVAIVDGRAVAGEEGVPARDIVGWVEVRGGEPVEGSYRPNREHAIVSENGMMRLPGELQFFLVEAMRNLSLDDP